LFKAIKQRRGEVSTFPLFDFKKSIIEPFELKSLPFFRYSGRSLAKKNSNREDEL
jgi:hypothetical protein